MPSFYPASFRCTFQNSMLSCKARQTRALQRFCRIFACAKRRAEIYHYCLCYCYLVYSHAHDFFAYKYIVTTKRYVFDRHHRFAQSALGRQQKSMWQRNQRPLASKRQQILWLVATGRDIVYSSFFLFIFCCCYALFLLHYFYYIIVIISGRWNKHEHDLFLRGLEMYGKEWKKMAGMVRLYFIFYFIILFYISSLRKFLIFPDSKPHSCSNQNARAEIFPKNEETQGSGINISL